MTRYTSLSSVPLSCQAVRGGRWQAARTATRRKVADGEVVVMTA